MLALAGCGGAVDLAGVGSGGTGLAEGTISGFGSIFVDGVEYDDSAARAVAQDAGGATVDAVTAVGKRVRVEYDSASRLKAIEVLPQLVGTVTGVFGSTSLQVDGQWVAVGAAVSAPDPVLAGGLAAITDLVAGDAVEVHGSWTYDATRAAYVLGATRVEKLAAAPASAIVGGVVFSSSATGFRLNSASGTLVTGAALPAGVGDGALVRVWLSSYERALDRATARRVAATPAPASSVASLTLTGNVLSLDGAGAGLVVQGVPLRVPSGFDLGAVARGDFVQVVAGRDASGWVLQSVQPRGSASQLGGAVQLRGTLTGVDWRGMGPMNFTLRGTQVKVSAQVLAASGCGAFDAATPLYVELSATRGAEPLSVTAMSCRR